MSNGIISGNTAGTYGGGVYVNNGPFTKTSAGTIYGYNASDTLNSNVIKDSSGTVLNDRGHTVYVYINSSSNKRKETTVGPGVNLAFNGANGTFMGEWDN